MMLFKLGEKIAQNQGLLEEFFQEQSRDLPPPFYLSCDIRHSGNKLGVIDTNLFPAGFNNLCEAYSRQAVLAIRKYLSQYYPSVEKIIILSEEHTRNRYYLENVDRLRALFKSVGVEVRVAYLGNGIPEAELEVSIGEGRTLPMGKLKILGEKLMVGNFEGDLIISNNDFSQGIPENFGPILNRILPSPHLGWNKRRKSQHFNILQDLIGQLADLLQLDPWLLRVFHRSVSIRDLASSEDLKRLSEEVKYVLDEIQSKYDQYEIREPPYVFIKNEAGTYGMGLWDVGDPEEVLRMNRRTRNKLLSAKGGNPPKAFLIQEGIPTADFYSNLPIEPVIYMIGYEPIGGFFRMNAQKDAQGSLNTRGMIFSCLCLHKLDEPHEENFLNCAEKEHLVQMGTVMARVATLAAAKEQAQIKV